MTKYNLNKKLDVKYFEYSFELTGFVNRHKVEIVKIIYHGNGKEDKHYRLFYYTDKNII